MTNKKTGNKGDTIPSRSFIFAVLCVLSVGWLTGCGSVVRLPDADPGTTPLGTIHGLNLGGHAPLAGSHIYLLEAGNSGYGSVVKSLIRSSAAGATANGSWTNSGYGGDLFVPSADSSGNPFYGLTVDSQGSFTLTGDYSCDVGRVVYLVGVGGNPGANGSASAPTQVGYYTAGSGAAETATVLVAYSAVTPNVGDILRFSGSSGTLAGLSGQTGPVSSIPIAGSLFAVTVADANGSVLPTNAAGSTYFTGLGTVQSTPFNHAVVNVAILGTCPASGSFASTIPYIYMNEVSTVAAAYALAPYSNGTSGLTNQNGLDAFHIGGTATTLGLQGIENAAANAANLYDITGTNAQTGATHNALATTPTNTNGTVPQTELDTLANVLASCVDSGNNYRGGLGTLQASCQTLFQYASSNGVYDTSTNNGPGYSNSTMAFNTFQAAVNLARFPQGAGTGTTNSSGVQSVSAAFSTTTASNFASGIYGLESGTIPFTPNLHSTGTGAPNSYAVSLVFTGNGMNIPQGLAIDGSGNAWVGSVPASGGYVSKFSSAGAALLDLTGNGLQQNYTVAIDSSGNVWVPNSAAINTFSEFSGAGTPVRNVSGNGLQNPYGVAIDASGNVWISDYAQNGSYALSKFSGTGGALLDITGNGLGSPEVVGIDGAGSVWVANSGASTVSKFSNAGAAQLDLTGNGLSGSVSLAIDSAGDVWIANFTGSSVSEFSNSGTALLDVTGNGLNGPHGVAIDGTGNVWVTNRSGNGVSAFSSAGSALLNLTGNGLSAPDQIAIDGSGDAWVTNGSGNSVTEFVGVAPPVITPLCAALPTTPTSNGSSNLGTRP